MNTSWTGIRPSYRACLICLRNKKGRENGKISMMIQSFFFAFNDSKNSQENVQHLPACGHVSGLVTFWHFCSTPAGEQATRYGVNLKFTFAK